MATVRPHVYILMTTLMNQPAIRYGEGSCCLWSNGWKSPGKITSLNLYQIEAQLLVLIIYNKFNKSYIP